MFKTPSVSQLVGSATTLGIIYLPTQFAGSKPVVSFIVASLFILAAFVSIAISRMIESVPAETLRQHSEKTLAALVDYGNKRAYHTINFSVVAMSIFTVLGKELALVYIVSAYIVNANRGFILRNMLTNK